MDTAELFQRLGLALAIGLLIGLERGWRERDAEDGSRAAGIRTFALTGLLGGIWAALTPALGPWPLALAGLGFAGAFTLFQYREAVARKEFSATSTVAGMVTFALGAFAVLGDMAVAGAAGVVTMTILAARQNLHEFVRRLTWPELRSGVLLLAMTFVLLPILPDRPLDPWGAFNPHEIWLMTVLIAALSFAGYAAVRAVGERQGLLLGAAAGALVSSTTVTFNDSRLAAKSEGAHHLLATSVCIAWAVSVTRMLVVASVVNQAMLTPLAWPMSAAAAVLVLAAYAYNRLSKGDGGHDGAVFDNPFELKVVISFGVLLAVVLFATKILGTFFGEPGLLGLAAVSGLADVDPITLSVAKFAGVSVPMTDAVNAILLAGIANMLTKMAVTAGIGGPRFGMKLVPVGILAVAAGAAVWFLGIGQV